MEDGRSRIRRKRAAKDQRNRCYYCNLRMDEDDMTWEHLVSRSHGGNNSKGNLRVAHAKCNVLVGTLPANIKRSLHELALQCGSDVFFQTVAQLNKLPHGTLAIVNRRRPKRMSERDWKRAPPIVRHIFEEAKTADSEG